MRNLCMMRVSRAAALRGVNVSVKGSDSSSEPLACLGSRSDRPSASQSTRGHSFLLALDQAVAQLGTARADTTL
jgi:hypothetical protein